MTAEHVLALLTPSEMGAADRFAIADGTPSMALMERAGAAVAEEASRMAAGGAVLLACGPGSNGGDGYVAARLLADAGLAVTVAAPGARRPAAGDAAAMAARWNGPVGDLTGADPSRFALVVDALFGAGLTRPPEGEAADFVERLASSETAVLAVDMPSGLSGATGKAEGAVAPADATVTFFRLKPGHLLQPGRQLCGRIVLADIGLSAANAFAPGRLIARSFANEPLLWRGAMPARETDTHKYKRGAVLVLAGGITGVGAPRLAARAALRSGAGAVTVACRPEALAAHAARGPDALMLRPVRTSADLDTLLGDSKLRALVAGPALGLDATARMAVHAALRAQIPLVLDADALTLLGRDATSLRRRLERRGAPVVLTPHEGEFARLFGHETSIVDGASKLDRARAAAEISGAIIILKGSDTVIASPDGRAAINSTGTPDLATAGAGDVLAGLVGGLIAQGMPGFEAACCAVWAHGEAGRACGMGLIADDLPEAMPHALKAARGENG